MADSGKDRTSFLVLPAKVTTVQEVHEEDKDHHEEEVHEEDKGALPLFECRRNAVLLPEQQFSFCTFRDSTSELLDLDEMHCASWWCTDEQCPSVASTPRCDTMDHAFGMSNVDAGDTHKECMGFNNTMQCSPDIGDHEIALEEASDVHEPTDAKALDSFNREIDNEDGTEPDSSGYSKTSNHNTPASKINPTQQRANGPHDDVATSSLYEGDVAFIQYVQEHCQICAIDIKPTVLARMRDLRTLFHMLAEKRVVRMVCSSSESVHASNPHQARKRPPVESIFGFSRMIVDQISGFNDEITRMVRDDVNRSVSLHLFPPKNL
jgi:hypothetical protein